MLQYNPTISGSLNITGSLIISNGMIGTVNGVDVEIFSSSISQVVTNIQTTTGSQSGRLTSIESFTSSTSARLGSIETISASNLSRINSIETITSSNIARLNAVETITASNIARLTSLEITTGSLATTGSNTFIGTQTITGSLFISSNLVVQGTSSLQNITASAVSIGTNIVNLNTANPAIRYAGLVIGDSGSIGSSGSFLYDSVQDEMIFVHRGANTTVTSSVTLMGPQTFDNIGNETYPTLNRLVKGLGYEHIGDSNIIDDGTIVCVNATLKASGQVCGVMGNFSCVGVGTSIPANLLSVYNTTSTAVSQLYISNPASNGTGGGNRGFDASFTSTTTSFTGTDSADQGYGYFPLTIVNGQTYTIHFKSTAVNGTLGTIITSTGTNFATDTIQTISLPTITDDTLTSIRFTATGAANYIGFAGYRTGGTMSLTISEVSIVKGIPDIETGAMVAYKGIATNRINIQAPTTACIPTLGCADCTTGLVVSNFDTRYGMLLGTLNTGVGWIQQGRYDGTATSYGLSLQPNGGNIGIGTTTPQSTLHIGPSLNSMPAATSIAVPGDTSIRFMAGSDGNANYGSFIAGTQVSGVRALSLGSRQGEGDIVTMTLTQGNVGIGAISPNAPLHICNACTITNMSIQNVNCGGYALYQAKSACTVYTWQWGSWNDGTYRIGQSGVGDYMTIATTGTACFSNSPSGIMGLGTKVHEGTYNVYTGPSCVLTLPINYGTASSIYLFGTLLGNDSMHYAHMMYYYRNDFAGFVGSTITQMSCHNVSTAGQRYTFSVVDPGGLGKSGCLLQINITCANGPSVGAGSYYTRFKIVVYNI